MFHWPSTISKNKDFEEIKSFLQNHPIKKLNLPPLITDEHIPYFAHLDIKEVDLGKSKFEGFIKLANFANNVIKLKFLDNDFATECNITDTGIISLITNSRIESINLYNCNRITDKGFSAISQNKLIKNLKITNCTINSEAIRAISQSTSIKKLKIKNWDWNINCTINSEAIEALSRSDALESLTLMSHPQITENDLINLTKNKNIKHLKLIHMDIPDSFIEKILTNNILETLDLSDCQISDSSLELLSNSRSIKTLKLTVNDNSREAIHKAIKVLAKNPFLLKLNLECSKLQDEDLVEFADTRIKEIVIKGRTEITNIRALATNKYLEKFKFDLDDSNDEAQSNIRENLLKVIRESNSLTWVHDINRKNISKCLSIDNQLNIAQEICNAAKSKKKEIIKLFISKSQEAIYGMLSTIRNIPDEIILMILKNTFDEINLPVSKGTLIIKHLIPFCRQRAIEQEKINLIKQMIYKTEDYLILTKQKSDAVSRLHKIITSKMDNTHLLQDLHKISNYKNNEFFLFKLLECTVALMLLNKIITICNGAENTNDILNNFNKFVDFKLKTDKENSARISITI